MGLIYMRISPINGKYIGQTVRDESTRWAEHCKEACNINSKSYNSILNQAIRMYGKENFSVIILEDNIKESELDQKEQYYIQKYNTFYIDNPIYGYNMTRGGNNGTIKYTDSFLLDIWNEGLTIKEIKNKYNMNYNNISYRLKSLGITKEEINQRAYIEHNNKRKAVAQYTLSGKYIKTFNSITEAAKEIKSNTTNISSVCNGKRKSCKGYIWKYI